MTFDDDIHRRVRIVYVPAIALARIFAGELGVVDGIPDGASIGGIVWSLSRDAFAIGVRHWSFDPIPEGEVAPEVVVSVKALPRRGISLGSLGSKLIASVDE